MHIHVLMLRRMFELIPIKICLFTIFLIFSKSSQKHCTIVQNHWPNFIKNEWEEILHFYNFFLMHIHVLMLPRMFELIPIKICLFTIF